MKNGSWKIYMDGWTYDYAFTFEEALEKVNSYIAITKTVKEIIIYNVETKEKHTYNKLA